MEPDGKFYQPYEVRAFTDGREFLSYMKTDLIKNILTRLYELDMYNKIVEWFTPIVQQYPEAVK
jgi:hypothetical protein